MARIIRVSMDINAHWNMENILTLVVEEQIRTARPRRISDILIGSTVRSEHVDLAVQIAEDSFRAAIGRTLGVQQQLPF